jgi:SAM-dependent methyltransferase
MRAAMDLDPDALDYSMFSADDLVNLVLQRSDVLFDVPNRGRLIRQWEAGDVDGLNAKVAENGLTYARRAARIIKAEFEQLRPLLDPFRPGRIADIGCGYAIFDLFAYHAWASHLLLIDIEDTEQRHFGFQDEGAAYTSLPTAQAFLAANGVPPDRVTTWNPEQADLADDAPVDLAVSLLSCGFHYPVDMYMPFFRFGVRPGGVIVLDLRAGKSQAIRDRLKPLGRLKVLSEQGGVRRVMIRRKGKA